MRLWSLVCGVAVACLVWAAPASGVGFHSPSGNIGCVLSASGVRCDIRERTWQPPAKPRSCELDFGHAVAVSGNRRAGYVCAGDTTLGQGRVLGYGESIQRKRFRCQSRMSGMKCRNRRSGHGFTLSRERVRLF